MLSNVIENDFCIGCGNCSIIKPNKYKLDESRIAVKIIDEYSDSDSLLDKICPFSGNSKTEDEINNELYSGLNNYHPDIGYYENVYIGWDNNDENRQQSSSGGLATYLVNKLLEEHHVEIAILASYSNDSKCDVEYAIYRKQDILSASRQSKYKLVSYAMLSEELKTISESFVFVGIPCHVKSIRLLADTYENIMINLKYAISVFCGHQKKDHFSKFISWQMGINPSEAKDFKYRVKKANHKSHEYYYSVKDSQSKTHEKCVTDLKWLDWGIGLFKHKACDFCDDVAGETSDIIFGDAWIKPYTSDYLGTNVAIVRNLELKKILKESNSNKEITLIPSNIDSIFASQGANFRHRKEGLLSRIALYEGDGAWYPNRRKSLFENHTINDKRDKLYIHRHKLSMQSNNDFEKALAENNLNVFYENLGPLVIEYNKLYSTPKMKLRKMLQKLRSLIK